MSNHYIKIYEPENNAWRGPGALVLCRQGGWDPQFREICPSCGGRIPKALFRKAKFLRQMGDL